MSAAAPARADAPPSRDDLLRENDSLRRRLEEVEATLRAIREGEVDALVVTQADRASVLTLDTADRPLRVLVDQLDQAAAALTTAGAIIAANAPFAALARAAPAALAGADLRDLVDPASRPLVESLLADAAAGRVAEGEVVLRAADGARRPLFLGVTPLRDASSGQGLLAVDLSERKRRERLVADEALARSILEQVADAVVVCDTRGLVVRASRAAHALCGASPLHRAFADAFPLEARDDHRPDLAAAWRGETVRGREVTLARPDGARFELLLGAGPLLASGGAVLGAVVTLTDITALRRAEDALRQRAEALQEADRRKDEFLAMLAHELRNPLSPIATALEVMNLRDVDAPEARRARDVIGRQVQQLTRLVGDLLEVSRIRSGKITLHRAPVDLAAAVARAAETVAPFVAERRHALDVRAPVGGVWVDGDLARLAQVVGNLVHNAAKYTDPGGRIDVSVAREGAEAVVRVRDSGVGIPPHMLSQVFDLFTQVDVSLDRSQGGLGIGLALVRRLVGMHGGRVEARSEGEGRGSEFVVRLPAIDAPADRPAVTDPRARDAVGPRRVLVVDDNPDALETAALLLELLGHEVRAAANGVEALAVAAEFAPDLVLCDIGLPLMDGYEVARRLRADPRFAGVRLVALTGYGRDEDAQRSRASGFDAHLVKPFDLDKFARALAT
ncbi:MAG: ATP-binding protein [Polyangiales bacterium]